MNNAKLSKCNFCSYKTATGCMVTPNSYYCKRAADELDTFELANKSEDIYDNGYLTNSCIYRRK